MNVIRETYTPSQIHFIADPPYAKTRLEHLIELESRVTRAVAAAAAETRRRVTGVGAFGHY